VLELAKKIADLFSKSAASVCSTSFNKEVEVEVGDVKIIKSDEFKTEWKFDSVFAEANIIGKEGKHLLFFKKAEAVVLSGLLVMEERKFDEAAEFTADDIDSIKELGNQVMGSIALSSATDVGVVLGFDQTNVSPINLSVDETDLKNAIPDDEFVFIHYKFSGLEAIPDCEVVEVFSSTLLASLQGELVSEPEAQQVEFADLEQQAPKGVTLKLDIIMDVPVQVTVELGRTNMMIKDILELSQGSIIELTKLAGEPVDILVNDKLVAKGEVVVIDENFGVRISSIVDQEQRIKSLGA